MKYQKRDNGSKGKTKRKTKSRGGRVSQIIFGAGGDFGYFRKSDNEIKLHFAWIVNHRTLRQKHADPKPPTSMEPDMPPV